MRWIGILVALALAVGCAPAQSTSDVGSEGRPRTVSDVQLDELLATGQPWDLVYVTDSTGWGVASHYADRAGDALGIEVRSHDLTRGGLSAATILRMLDQAMYAEQIAEAEIIVVFGNPEGSGVDLPDPDIGTCISTSSYTRTPPAPSSDADWVPYRDLLGRVFDRIWELRAGRPTVIRAVDMYAPVTRAWDDAGILDGCLREFRMMSDQIRAAAGAHGVEMVSILDALNGPEHDRDLVALGWIRADGEHLNDDGARASADALAAAGFLPLLPPGR